MEKDAIFLNQENDLKANSNMQEKMDLVFIFIKTATDMKEIGWMIKNKEKANIIT